MTLTRRQFTTSMIGAAGAATLGPFAIARLLEGGAFFEWTRLGDGAWAALGGGGNALLVKSRGEALLIDCKNFGLGPILRDECLDHAESLTMVINTHHHGDHVGGNPSFNTMGVPLVAHENAEPRLEASGSQALSMVNAEGDREQRSADSVRGQGHTNEGGERAAGLVPEAFEQVRALGERAFVPARTVGAGEDIRVGALTVRVRHAGPAHTDNDICIHIPELNLLHTGDLCFHNLHPFIDMGAGATSAGWITFCDAMLSMCDGNTTVIPGHGAIGDRAAIEGQKRYFQVLRERMAEAHAQGMSPDEAVGITIDEFADYGFEQIRERTYGAVYDEMG